MDWMMMPLRKYADFSGRSRRKEYWMFALGVFLTMLVTSIVDQIIFGTPVLTVLVALGVFIPSLACQVRRFHDQDKSGWFVLLGLIPLVGGIVLLVFMCLEGTRGNNQFGPDPKGNDVTATFG
jgi:uncharacterized membrane protein YhaH (DUF805 family)